LNIYSEDLTRRKKEIATISYPAAGIYNLRASRREEKPEEGSRMSADASKSPGTQLAIGVDDKLSVGENFLYGLQHVSSSPP